MDRSGHRIRTVQPGSIASELEIEPGDVLLEIDGEPIEDIFDYRFAVADEELNVLIRKKDGEEWLLEIEKDPEEDLGLVFESGLMDDYRACCNRCIFCFIDQMPPGMRKTLYFKDDDSRLSFLQGNYVTLTNMREHDIDRIIRYRMEPINISFHTADPALRRRMLGNRRAGDIFPYVRRLADAGIEMNGQIVLCRGWNDGERLDETILALADYLPALRSVSVVPVGLTRYREGLTPLENFTSADAAALLKQIGRWQSRFRKEQGIGFVYASDEWYLLAGRDLPGEEAYDGYPQLENGVGMLRSLRTEVLECLREERNDVLPKERITVVTGELPMRFLAETAALIQERYPEKAITVRAVQNRFFGELITVAGLLTGRDILEQLRGEDCGDRILITCNMLRSGEEVFLDDLTVSDVQSALGVPVTVVGQSGADLVRAILGEDAGSRNKRRQVYEQTDRGDRGETERR